MDETMRDIFRNFVTCNKNFELLHRNLDVVVEANNYNNHCIKNLGIAAAALSVISVAQWIRITKLEKKVEELGTAEGDCEWDD